MKITIVNQLDEVIGTKESAKLTPKDIYRVSALWLTNPQGKILLAKRSKAKMHDPGKWGPVASGAVSAGEDYGDCIIRLIQEGIGLDNLEFHELQSLRRSHTHNYFCQWFSAVTDKKEDELAIDDKLEEVKWFTRAELEEDVKKHPRKYIAALALYLDLFK